MKRRKCRNEKKKEYIKPEIKSYSVDDLSESWNFEVFGKGPAASQGGPPPCCIIE